MASSAMEEAVIVDLQTVLSNRLDADCLKISCSGTFIDKENGLIVTSGLILSPVLQMKPDLQDACYHRKLATFFSEHGVVLSESQFVSDNTYLSGQPLLNYIDSISDINVYIQKQRQQDEDVMSAASNIFYSKCLFSIGAGGKKHFSHLKQCIEPSESHNNDKSWIKMPAKLLLIWRCPSLANILDTVLVHGSGWSLTDDTKNETAIEEQTLKNILPFFVLLKAKPQSDFIDNCTSTKLQNKINQTLSPYLFASLGNNFYNNQSTLQMVIKVVSKVIESIFKMPQIWKRERHSDGNTQPSFIDQLNISRTPNSLSFEYLKRVCEELPRLKVGDQLCIMATPFGSLSPNVFINSISKGIVTNLAGENDVLLLTDARCVPGCEGGAIYAQSSSSKR